MCKPTPEDFATTSTEEFEVDLEDLILSEKPANTSPGRDIVLHIPEGVVYTLDHESEPGALNLRIMVGGGR